MVPPEKSRIQLFLRYYMATSFILDRMTVTSKPVLTVDIIDFEKIYRLNHVNPAADTLIYYDSELDSAHLPKQSYSLTIPRPANLAESAVRRNGPSSAQPSAIGDVIGAKDFKDDELLKTVILHVTKYLSVGSSTLQQRVKAIRNRRRLLGKGDGAEGDEEADHDKDRGSYLGDDEFLLQALSFLHVSDFFLLQVESISIIACFSIQRPSTFSFSISFLLLPLLGHVQALAQSVIVRSAAPAAAGVDESLSRRRPDLTTALSSSYFEWRDAPQQRRGLDRRSRIRAARAGATLRRCQNGRSGLAAHTAEHCGVALGSRDDGSLHARVALLPSRKAACALRGSGQGYAGRRRADPLLFPSSFYFYFSSSSSSLYCCSILSRAERSGLEVHIIVRGVRSTRPRGGPRCRRVEERHILVLA